MNKVIGSFGKYVERSEKAFIRELDRQLEESVKKATKEEVEKDIMDLLKELGYVKRTGFEE